MKRTKDSIEFSLDEFADMMGVGKHICHGCGTLLPTWEWAKREGKGCEQCLDKPSQEDVDGKPSDSTPADWKPRKLTLADLQWLLEHVFDSVEETRDGTFIARKKLGYSTRNENVSAMKHLLEEALPRAGIETCGSVTSRGAILHWYVEFNMD